ncbi:hypothetical protein JCM10213_005228 [Rhodosporidiobolus nylandii]
MARRRSIAVALFSLALLPAALAAALPSSPASLASTSAALTEATSDGSGSAPYLHSPSFLLFSLESLVIGLVLLLAGHRLWRATTALGLGLLLELLVWVVIANTLPADGFSATSESKTSIIVWTLVSAAGVVGLAVGAWAWRVGVFAMGACTGVSLALSVAMMGENGLPEVARWVVLGVLTALGLVVLPLFANEGGMVVATSLTGSFLLFLGIDLLNNEVDGMSRGLRYILDGNSAHASVLSSYHPPVSTRVFIAASWAVAILAMIFQSHVYIHRQRQPFIRQVVRLKNVDSTSFATPDHDLAPDFASDYRLPSLPAGLSDEFSLRSPRSEQLGEADRDSTFRMQQRYATAVGESPEHWTPKHRGTSPLLPVETLQKIEAIRHPRELSSPDDPPSRPASVLSSEFGNGLRSRPPTFFDEPLSSGRQMPLRRATPPFPPDAFPPATSTAPTSSFVSHAVPIVAVPPHAAAVTRRPSIPTSVPVGPNSEDGATVFPPSRQRLTTITGSSGSGSGGAVSEPLTVGGQARAAFAEGLAEGELASLPATGRSPSSGDISTLLGRNFRSPAGSVQPITPPLPPQSVPQDVGRPSTETTRSFETADSSLQGFPTTPTEVRGMQSPLEHAGAWRAESREVRQDETEELR